VPQAWGPVPPSQRPAGPVLPQPPVSLLPPHQVRGAQVPSQPAGDTSQMQYFGAQPPMSGPPRPGHPPPVGPPPMNQPGMPPQNLPPVNPGPQTMMNMGFTSTAESHASNFASQGPPMSAAMHPVTSEMSGSSQFSAPPPPPHSQMNAGMPGYNYASSPPRVVQPGQAATSASGTALTAPMSQPQPRRLDPDQMPSPVSHRISYNMRDFVQMFCQVFVTVICIHCCWIQSHRASVALFRLRSQYWQRWGH